MNTFKDGASTRQTAITSLAVIGFVALMAFGMWLAVYSTRYVPTIVGRIGSAAVYLGSVFTPGSSPSLTVTENATSTIISFGESTSTPTSAATPPEPVAIAPKPAPVTAGPKTGGVYQIGGATSTPATLYGFPDLIVTIKNVGYLATTSADSFVAATSVPYGNRPAVTFSIKNIGTNVTGSWRFSATIPTQTSYLYQSLPQQSLAPGDSIDYTLGFDQANKGTDQMISITANFDHAVTESNLNNDSASAKLTILGN